VRRPQHPVAVAEAASGLPEFDSVSQSSSRLIGQVCPAEPQARSSPQARQGLNEAEWLDRARTAEQARVVMAALLGAGDAQRQNELDERDAQGWK
jgi:hypothetical protein